MRVTCAAAMFVTLSFTSPVWADQLISCQTAKVKTAGPTQPRTIQYVVKGTPSQRLASDLVYNNGSAPSLISSIQVAQYKFNFSEAYLSIDNASEVTTLILSLKASQPNKSQPNTARYTGTLEDHGDGTTTQMDCTASMI
jgi:hypothetical protein